MMSYEMFKKEVAAGLKDYLPEKYRGMEVYISPVKKVNVTLDGLRLSGRTEEMIASPTIYLNGMYADYVTCGDLRMILRTVADSMEKALRDVPQIDLSRIKDRIVFQLINTEQNRELLESAPHRKFHDLFIIYRWAVKVDSDGIHSAVVNNALADRNGLNEKQLFILAEENTRRILPPLIKSLDEIKKEVVFLPYKASMWDSLESVWKAADADPDCDAYVIPILYYNKNPDGSFREMHYEGDQYPDYVPITSYEEYDFETRKPDAIYIHNPYDEYNLVTSVPPFFFSSNLKKMTEKLVYISYFILGEIKSDEEERIEGMKHFVTTPAVFNAHKVIVQSEDMKQVYIKVLLDYTNDHSETARKYWDDKILGTGSPKIDKVLNTKREDLEIPQEWLKVIEKPDGSWKKIVFYNTSIGALLQYNEKMLQKMESVFEIFKENRDEVALLWRPHPLIKTTVESMRPQLWVEYDKLVRKYRQEGWGIYDDSSDVDRAIALSDAYYGDESSVVQLCIKYGTDVLLQNPNKRRLQDIKNIPIWFEDCVQIENDLWFSANDFNGLCKINIITGKTHYVARFPGEYLNADRLYTKIYHLRNKLVFMPHSAKNIAVYELEKNRFVTYNLGELAGINLEFEDKYQFVEEYDDFLYFFDIYAGVIKLNTVTGQLFNVMDNLKEKTASICMNADCQKSVFL